MNYKQKQDKKRELINLMRNPLKVRGIYKNNSLEHEVTKFTVAYLLLKQGFEVFIESDFHYGGKADLVAISNTGVGFLVEIVNSEKEKSLIKKQNNYPSELTFVVVNVNDFNPNTWCL